MFKKELVIIIILFVSNTSGIKFTKSIEAIGLPYYKILLSLGSCKGSLLFSEQLVWGRLTMHRIFDIYYESKEIVSRVEIELVISNTDVVAYSKYGVKHTEFYASLFLPPKTLAAFYALKIYSCKPPKAMDASESTTLASDSEYYYEDDYII